MKWNVGAWTMAALVAGSTAAQAQNTPTSLAIGALAPKADVKMASTDGRNLSITDVRGEKGTLVVFTCNHCPWAKAWQGRIVGLGNTYTKRGVGVIVVNPNDPEAFPEDAFAVMQERAKELKMAVPYVVDATSDVARAFGATHTPEAFLFDRKGKLVYHGGIDDNAKEPEKVTARWLRDALESTVAGKSVALKETKALGCSIKLRAPATSS
jgi:cytochrome oxidase Cu insertion factor (SCO1/SenC/PrrC family)